MNEQQQNEKSQLLAKEWFASHTAAIILNEEVTQINWRRPDTSNYAMTFTIFRNYVVVTGDVGDAIYGFGSVVTLETLRKFDWHYFINKCVASETGRHYTMKIPGIRSEVPNVRAIAHFIGLQMALTQVDKQLTTEAATAILVPQRKEVRFEK